ncbi:MAG: di-heme oxidoredictase family protein, partial [Thermoanaerobaculia bacterium]
ERDDDPHCAFNATPEDVVTLDPVANTNSAASAHAADSLNFAMFARFLAPPAPSPSGAAQRGASVFATIGCDACHIAVQRTGASPVAALSNVAYQPYSDFALHNMGQALNDRIAQGGANGADWRTAPLWGLGQRVFFLHDGRTNDLGAAIEAHASQGSEANGVIARFNQLSRQDAADLLDFLRSL